MFALTRIEEHITHLLLLRSQMLTRKNYALNKVQLFTLQLLFSVQLFRAVFILWPIVCKHLFHNTILERPKISFMFIH